jgi:hypothetical protein
MASRCCRYSDAKAAPQLPQRVEVLLVAASQPVQRHAEFRRQPKKISVIPTTVPIGHHITNKNPPNSINTPARVLTRARRLAATPRSRPGSMTLLWHSGHSASAPAFSRKYGKFFPQWRHRQERISLLKAPNG